jgi:SPOR domain
MGTPINTPLTSEIWHLTIDDLLEPLPASPRLGGPGPFVINLSASTAPISVPMKAVAEHPGTHVYQIQRTEDRRVRYRLRFGPFETEAEAEGLLSTVREIYPSALTATAEPEDLRNIEAIKNKIEAQQLAMVKAAMSKAAAASPPNVRPGLARVAPPEPTEQPSAPTDGEALPTSPPPAWLALRTPTPAPTEHSIELDVPAPAAKPSPKPPPSVKAAAPAPAKSAREFAPARWSAAARAFVPSADFGSAPAAATTPASPATTATTAAPAAPARPDVPTVSVVPESLIPVLSDSVMVPRSMPASRPAASPVPAPKVSGPAPTGSPAPAVVTAAGSTAPLVVTAPPVVAAPPVVTAPPAPTAPPVATAPAAMAAPPVASVRPVTPAPVGVSASAAPSGAMPARPAPAPAVSSAAVAPRMMPEPRTATAAPRTEPKDARVASFDTTQTLRPLTPTELQDAASLRWFVIQLSCSEEVFDPDALPNLDIFSEYRLYSVASLEQGKTMHSLRVGFFSEESHAKAVAGYLGTFYNEPTVKRISAAERTRFAQHRVEARKDIGATGKHAVIEITDERVIRPKRPGSTSVSPMRPPLPTPPSVRGR